MRPERVSLSGRPNRMNSHRRRYSADLGSRDLGAESASRTERMGDRRSAPALRGPDPGTVRVMPSDFALKTMNAVHRTILKVSGDRMGWTAGKMPVLELTTTGRKSGQSRTVMLTSPVQDGDTFVIVASKGGEDSHPAWYLNLVAHPEVQVRWKGGPVQTMTSRVADAEERDRLWPEITTEYGNYAGYQRKTEREIPLVLLTPG